MMRSAVWLLLLGALVWPQWLSAASVGDTDWERYKQAFIQDGRVIDVNNQGISHSEGQGYGLLLALAFEDRASFEQIWAWTRKNLQREDKLFGWRWHPGSEPHVQDWNNATDGDLLIAWALAQGGERWKRKDWIDEARAIAQRIRTTLIHVTPFGPTLLPAQSGFKEQSRLILNPSYWVYPAFKDLARIDPDPVWPALQSSGLALLQLARFGPHQLPPDWAILHSDQRLGLLEGALQRRMAYDAIRIPLYLCWAGIKEPHTMQAFMHAWPSLQAPAWFDLANDDRAAFPLGLAQQAIFHLLPACTPNKKNAPMALEVKADDYYGSTLALFSRLISTSSRSLP